MYQALYRKWRPKLFDDVVGQGHITETLKRQVSQGRTSHAYLFTGTRGTGKTTCAKILAKAVNCTQPVDGNPCCSCPACRGIDDGSILDVVELDAASNNGVDQVRALRDEAVYSPAAVRKRVYIIDEVHMLSGAAFNSLLKILEEPPEHLMFILATTELHKVPATILSRCQRFSFKRIQASDIIGRLHYVADAEGIPLTQDGAALLARLADGGLRDALSLLDQCAVSGAEVNRAEVLDTLGLAGNLETARLMQAVRRGETAEALRILGELYQNGKDLSAVLGELNDLVRDLLVLHTAPGTESLLTGGYDEKTLRVLSQGLTPQRMLYQLSLLESTLSNLKASPNPRLDAEVCIIRMSDDRLEDSPEALSARLASLEQRLSGVSLVPSGGAMIEPALSSETRADALPEISLPAQATAPAADILPPETPAAAAAVENRIPEPVPAASPVPAERPAPAAPERRAAPQRPAQGGGSPRKEPAATPSKVPAENDCFWQELLPSLKEPLGMSVYTFLMDSKKSVGQLSGSVLTICARDSFSYHRINRPAVLNTISQAASARAGTPVRVRLVDESAVPGGGQLSLTGEAPPAPRRAVKPAGTVQERKSARIVPQRAAAPAPGAQDDPMESLASEAEGIAKGILTVQE